MAHYSSLSNVCTMALSSTSTGMIGRSPFHDSARVSIAFIDAALADYSHLISGITAGTDVVLLATDEDGIERITDYLNTLDLNRLKHSELTSVSVHIFSHGSPGCLYLGNSQLSLDTLSTYTEQLQSWFAGVSWASPSLYLYGCNVAAGDAGEEFVNALHQLTGAEIAASTTLTGAQSLGGDWNLDYQTGPIVAPCLLSEEVQASYASVMATFVVDTTIDEDGELGTGWGASLREAIAAANANPGHDEITFDSSLSGSTLELWLGDDLQITDDLTITGLGADQLTIDAGSTSRIFNINDGNENRQINVEISGLTIAEGFASEGGGIYVEGENFTLTDSVLRDNIGAWGGGIFARHVEGFRIPTNTINIQNSIIEENIAGNSGGGIAFKDTNVTITTSIIRENQGGGIDSIDNSNLKLVSSLVSGNTGDEFGGIAVDYSYAEIIDTTISNNSSTSNGGGINIGTYLSIKIVNSLIVGNSAEGDGGGIYQNDDNTRAGSHLRLTNSTVSGNTAGGNGGGLHTGRYNTDATIRNSTIVYNTAGGEGSGIFFNDQEEGDRYYGTYTTLASTIVALNSGNKDIAATYLDSFTSYGHNLIGNVGNYQGFSAAQGDIIGTPGNPVDPKINPLADNGGPTLTHALQPNSPAREAGSNLLGLTVDQRGERRLQGFSVDIGAFEAIFPGAIRGTPRNDTLTGTNGVDVIDGLGGNDDIDGLDGHDALYGDDGNDNLDGGEGNDLLIAGRGTDFARGALGDDVLSGGEGNDELRGSQGNDLLTGDEGDDVLDGGDHDDLVYGDRIYASREFPSEQGNDRLNGGKGDDVMFGDSEYQFFVYYAPDEQGDDTLYGDEGNDVLSGDSNLPQNNTSRLLAGDDVLYGGIGDDTLYGESLNRDSSQAFQYNTGHDHLYGEDGNDTLYGQDGNDRLFGGNGSDILYDDLGSNYLNGGNGSDRLISSSQDSDTLVGGKGKDVLTGGIGFSADRFYFEGTTFQADIITDFQVGIDKIQLNIDRRNDSFGELRIAQVGSDTRIRFRGSTLSDDSILLEDVAANTLKASDFVFGALS